jgi:hypothetical protein
LAPVGNTARATIAAVAAVTGCGVAAVTTGSARSRGCSRSTIAAGARCRNSAISASGAETTRACGVSYAPGRGSPIAAVGLGHSAINQNSDVVDIAAVEGNSIAAVAAKCIPTAGRSTVSSQAADATKTSQCRPARTARTANRGDANAAKPACAAKGRTTISGTTAGAAWACAASGAADGVSPIQGDCSEATVDPDVPDIAGGPEQDA